MPPAISFRSYLLVMQACQSHIEAGKLHLILSFFYNSFLLVFSFYLVHGSTTRPLGVVNIMSIKLFMHAYAK
jgi:hypothetical protein